MAKQEFTVLRRHDGDREYRPGDTRTAEAGEVAHLVEAGVLEKARKKPANKAKRPAPANKSK